MGGKKKKKNGGGGGGGKYVQLTVSRACAQEFLIALTLALGGTAGGGGKKKKKKKGGGGKTGAGGITTGKIGKIGTKPIGKIAVGGKGVLKKVSGVLKTPVGKKR